jgi:ribose-phosphate pyrophosphokinase
VIIIPGSGATKLGRDIALSMNVKTLEFDTRKFPDGERYVRLNGRCDGDIVSVVQSTYKDPDGLLMEYCMLADAALGAGASEVLGVFPYLAYLRQDQRFKDGETLSSKVFAQLIESVGTTKVFVVDPHLHRLSSLDVLFNVPAFNLSAMFMMAEYASKNFHLNDPIVVAPDEEASQWANKVATVLKAGYVVAKKVRSGDLTVEIDFSGSNLEGRDVLLVDDIVSTGGTLASITTKLKKAGATRVIALVTHGLFASGAYERISGSGVDHIITTDTVPNERSIVSVAPIIKEALDDAL